MSYAKLHNSFVRTQIWGFNQSQSARKFQMFTINTYYLLPALVLVPLPYFNTLSLVIK